MSDPSWLPPKLTGQAHFADLPVSISGITSQEAFIEYAASMAWVPELQLLCRRSGGHHPGGHSDQLSAVCKVDANPSNMFTAMRNAPFAGNLTNLDEEQDCTNQQTAGYPEWQYGLFHDGTGTTVDRLPSAYNLHVYAGLSNRPASWGAGPASFVTGTRGHSHSFVQVDPTQAVGGYMTLPNTIGDYRNAQYPTYNGTIPVGWEIGSTNTAADTVARCDTLQGWFVNGSGGGGYPGFFISHMGTVDTSWPNLTNGYADDIYMVDDRHNCFMSFSGGDSTLYGPHEVRKLQFCDLTTKTVTSTKPSGPPPYRYDGHNISPMTFTTQWVPQRDSIWLVDWDGYAGIPQYDNKPLYVMTPPATGNRFANNASWVSTLVPSVHWSEDTGGAPQLRPAAQNQSAVVWVPEYDCLIAWSDGRYPPQVIRLPDDFNGPDPAPAVIPGTPVPPPPPPPPPTPTPPPPAPSPSPSPAPSPSPTPSPAPAPSPSPAPAPAPTPTPPPTAPRTIYVTLGAAAANAQNVTAQVFTKVNGHAQTLLFTQGFSDSLNTRQMTLPGASGGNVYITLGVPGTITTLTSGQVVRVYLSSATYSSFFVDGVVT